LLFNHSKEALFIQQSKYGCPTLLLRTEGKTKMIFDKETGRVLGGAIVGINAGEICLAIEMGADAEDVGLTIHAHPTLNESIGLAAEIFEGSITDLPNAKAVKKKK
jgi:dihydrolipoamide dehydrogenase